MLCTGPEQEMIDCIKCPTHGICSGRKLTCEPGYREVSGTCSEDLESAIYAEELAQDAAKLLQIHAGRAECGEAETRYLTQEELHEALVLKHSDGQDTGFFSFRRREYEPVKFNLAFDKALQRLAEEDFPDISVSAFNEYSSNEARLTLNCRIWLALWRNMQYVVSAIVAVCALIYFRIRAYMQRKEQEKLDRAYAAAIDIIWDRKKCYMQEQEENAFIPDVVLRQEVLGFPTMPVIQFWKKVETILQTDNRVLYKKNQVVKGHPMNTFEWRGRISTSGIMASGGSVRSFDSMPYSDGFSGYSTPSGAPPSRPGTPTQGSRFESVQRWLFRGQ